VETSFERYGARITGDRLEQPHGIAVVASVERDDVQSVRPREDAFSTNPGGDRVIGLAAIGVSIAAAIIGVPMAGVGAGGLVPIIAVACIVPLVVGVSYWLRSSRRCQVLEVRLKNGGTMRIVLEAFCDSKKRDEVGRELADRGWPVEFR
jgi:hypothetical protein